MSTCPLCSGHTIKKLRELSTEKLADHYQKDLNIDIKPYISGISRINQLECQNCRYGFFEPDSCMGDGKFYKELQKYPWYYMEEKWEHTIALKHLTAGSQVLEAGCAQGDFIERLNKKNIHAEGIEFNHEAALKGRQKGLVIHEESLESLGSKKHEPYDAICAFQVLEHLSQPKSFINDAIDLLKTGGKLIISIPNHDSFLGSDKMAILDMPPHHAGLYREATLTFLPKILPLKLIELKKEPLQKYHYKYYFYTSWLPKLAEKRGFLAKVVKNSVYLVAYPILMAAKKKLKGHTMIAVYEKL